VTRLSASLRESLKEHQKAIEEALIQEFSGPILQGTYGPIAMLLKHVKEGERIDSVSIDGRGKKWQGSLFNDVLRYFLDDNNSLSVANVLRSKDVPKPLLRLTYAMASVLTKASNCFCADNILDLFFNFVDSKYRCWPGSACR
jgi:hypothetical protein